MSVMFARSGAPKRGRQMGYPEQARGASVRRCRAGHGAAGRPTGGDSPAAETCGASGMLGNQFGFVNFCLVDYNKPR